MVTLTGEQIYLRALEPEDLDFIYHIENNENVWEISATQTPYSRFLIKQYLENAHLDIYEAKQLRLMICSKDNKEAIGLIDLFDFNPTHNRAGVGVLIVKEKDRSRGYGKEALSLIIKYGKTHLRLHQLYANISGDNIGSMGLFEKQGFQKIGIKKEWNLIRGEYKDELLYQLLYVH